jgi:ATP-binding cassette subfamily B (MDR/TAP) protein 1
VLGSLAIGGFFLSIYGYYSYAFYTGSFFVTIPVNNAISGTSYTSGDIMSCFLGVVYGIFSLGMATPNFKAIAEGKIAGRMAFEVIDRVPKILLDDKDSTVLTEIKGKIEFKNVTFRYPTRKD